MATYAQVSISKQSLQERLGNSKRVLVFASVRVTAS